MKTDNVKGFNDFAGEEAEKREGIKKIITYVFERYGFKPVETLNGKILISGFWGKGRKLNYSGEILTYLVIVLSTGLISPIPLVLPVSLLILLMQRAWRDERRCKKKYGELWEEYCKIAKYKMIPKIY